MVGILEYIINERLLREAYYKMEYNQIEDIFTYHKPNGTQPTRYEMIRAKAKELAHLINNNTPPSAEQTLAIRKLQESVMFANASIAIHEPAR